MATLGLRSNAIKNVLSQDCSYKPLVIFFRNSGYKQVLPGPVYEARKEAYRKCLLRPMEEMDSIADRLKALSRKEPAVNISLPSNFHTKNAPVKKRLEWRKMIRSNKELEKQALSKTLNLDLQEVYEDWLPTVGPFHIERVAKHYGVYEHLFKHAYFTPYVPLKICYEGYEESVNPVYCGNILSSNEVEKTPLVSYDSKPNDLWTLILTNLDGHLLDTESEYLHWFIGNIKGCDLSTGEMLCHYLQPFPWRGTGYHRLVFVLYKQEKIMDFSSFQKPSPCHCLKERTFSTFDFYKAHQDYLTPAGMAFFQCTWGTNMTDFVHNVLEIREPVFEYNEPKVIYDEQIHFPEREPFNLYLDRYRDPKEVNKEVLLKRLKTLHPLEEEPPMPKYPVLHKPDNYLYSWQKDDIHKERLRLGKYRALRPHSVYPQEDNMGKYKYPS